MVKTLVIFVLCFALSGCATVFDAPPYWFRTDRTPNPLAPIQRVAVTPCGTDGCYSNGVKFIKTHLSPEAYRCMEQHEHAHACGWDHATDQLTPTNAADACGWHVPRC